MVNNFSLLVNSFIGIFFLHCWILIDSLCDKNYQQMIYSSTFIFSFILLRILLSTQQTCRIERTNIEQGGCKLKEIRVISYNTGMILLTGTVAEQKAALLSEYIKNYDIILLQEFFWNPISRGWGIDDILQSEGFDIVIPPSIPFWGVEFLNSGLLIALRTNIFKIESVRFDRFSDSESIDILSTKGVLQCTTECGLTILNTHAQADYSVDEDVFPYDGEHIETRKKQLSELVGWIPNRYENIVIGGDFNFGSRQEVDWFESQIGLDTRTINGVDAIFSNLPLVKSKTFYIDSDHLALETILKN